MAKNKKNRVSPANIIATIAVAALGVLTFFGYLFMQEDGDPKQPVIKAAVFIFLIGMLLILCIMAKTTEKEFSKWRVVEYVSLVAYLAVAIVFYKPTLQFFHVMQNKEKLQDLARNEIDGMDKLCSKYKNEAVKGLNDAVDKMETYRYSEQYKEAVKGMREQDTLYNYVGRIGDIDDWEKKVSAMLRYKPANNDSLKQRIEDWNLMDLSSIAFEMNQLPAENWDGLNKEIQKLYSLDLIPVIREKEDDSYSLDGKMKLDSIIGKRPETSAFTTEFRKPFSGFNIGILIYVLLHLLALMNYLLVRRSPIVQIRKDKREDDGGLVLDAD